MTHHDSGPLWLQHLSPEERAEAAAVIEALDMHRKLMAPLTAERRRLRAMALTRRWRAGAQQSDAA